MVCPQRFSTPPFWSPFWVNNASWSGVRSPLLLHLGRFPIVLLVCSVVTCACLATKVLDVALDVTLAVPLLWALGFGLKVIA